jgi:DNA-binding transcriptional regulator YdaS (Cro superfamily)
LHRACLVLGGAAQLAAQLGASEAAVRSWIEGIDEPPESAFLAAVEILLLNAEERNGTAS